MRTTFVICLITCTAIGSGLFQFQKYQDLDQETQHQVIRLEKELQSKVEDIETQFRLMKQQALGSKSTASERPLGVEIDYLIQVAALQWQSTQDPQIVLPWVDLAQTRIQGLNDPKLEPLVQALAHDRKTLSAASSINAQAVWTKVSEVLVLLEHTQVQKTSTLESTTTAATDHQPSATAQSPVPLEIKTHAVVETASTPLKWQAILANSLTQLKELIKVRHRTQPVQPLLTETERLLVQQELRLALEQSRLAALRFDQSLYNQTIQSAIQYLERYYDPENTSTQTLQEALNALAKLQVRTPSATLSCMMQLPLLRRST